VLCQQGSESAHTTHGPQLQREHAGATQPQQPRAFGSIRRNPWADPRDSLRNPYVSEDEAAEFWESERDRATQMPHIGSQRADQVRHTSIIAASQLPTEVGRLILA